MLCTDAIGYVTYLNGAAEKATGWPREEAVGHLANDVFRIIDGSTREPIRDPLQLAIIKNKPMVLKSNAILIRRNGSELTIADTIAPIHQSNGDVTGAVVVFQDVSEARAAALKISHLAHHDFLTDLPNRVLFDDRLNQAISLAQRHQRHIAVLFLDCDNFKNINDSLGHMMGDLLLQSLAKRIVSAGRSSDTVSRQGGDEFIILLPEVNTVEDATTYASKILTEVAKPHLIGGHELHVTASIGIAMYPADGRNADTLVHSADIALYEAKESGRNTYKCFRPGMKARALERQSAEGGLLNALEKEQFLLHYQPRMNLRTGAVIGAEALVRWRDPERGIVSPEDFIPLAEDSGLIVPIGRWVLRTACRQAMSWRDAGLPIGTLAVNVSPVEFRNSTYLDGITDLLASGVLEPGILELELTERTLVQDQQTAEHDTDSAVESGHQAGARRLRHRVLEPELSPAFRHQHPEDRSLFRGETSGGGTRPVAGRGDHQHGQQPGTGRGRRGVDTESQLNSTARIELHGGPGFPLLPSASTGRIRDVSERVAEPVRIQAMLEEARQETETSVKPNGRDGQRLVSSRSKQRATNGRCTCSSLANGIYSQEGRRRPRRRRGDIPDRPRRDGRRALRKAATRRV